MKLKIYERDDDSEVVCCFCDHNIRNGKGGTHCELDGHYISYVGNFANWCRHWRLDRKWKVKDEQTEMH